MQMRGEIWRDGWESLDVSGGGNEGDGEAHFC